MGCKDVIDITDIEWAMVHYDGNNDEPYADLVVDALRQKREVDALAAEYGIDAKTMLTLARSQIQTTKSNIKLMEENDQLRAEVDNAKVVGGEGTSAIKYGMRIGVASNSEDAAKKFMDKTFNTPYKVRKSSHSLTYYYKNGDSVMWFVPNEAMRGHKFNKVYIKYGTDQDVLNRILPVMLIDYNTEYFYID